MTKEDYAKQLPARAFTYHGEPFKCKCAQVISSGKLVIQTLSRTLVLLQHDLQFIEITSIDCSKEITKAALKDKEKECKLKGTKVVEKVYIKKPFTPEEIQAIQDKIDGKSDYTYKELGKKFGRDDGGHSFSSKAWNMKQDQMNAAEVIEIPNPANMLD